MGNEENKEQIENQENNSENTEQKAEEVAEKSDTAAAESNSQEETKEETAEVKSEESSEEKAEESKEESTEEKKEIDEKPAPKVTKTAEQAEIETQDKDKYNEVVEKLESLVGKDETIEVEVISTAKGGLRVVYESVPLFLPTSHYTLNKNVSESKLKEAVGKKLDVKVYEVKSIGEGKIVVVSRRDVLLKEVWDRVKEGEEVEGTVSSITDFGVFLDLGGIEGLVHVSRLSHSHVGHPKEVAKKGDTMKAKVISVDKKENKISLSKKALEDSPWKGAEEKFPAGTEAEGEIKRLTNFGAYVELAPGVEGLLRVGELSWTKRINKPSDILNEGENIKVKVLNLSEEKGQAALSIKQLEDNPWEQIANVYSEGTEAEGQVMRVFDKGAIVRIKDSVDAFMPISRINVLKKDENDKPVKEGDTLEVQVIDVVPKDESLVVSPKLTDEQKKELANRRKKGGKNRGGNRNQNKGKQQAKTTGGAVSLGDMLSSQDLENLKDFN